MGTPVNPLLAIEYEGFRLRLIDNGDGTQSLVVATSGGSSGIQYNEGSTVATPTGTVALSRDSSNVLHALRSDSSGNLLVTGSVSVVGTVPISGTVSISGNVNVTQGTSPWITDIQASGTALTATGSSLNVNITGGSSGNAAAGPTGSAVPADADYQGVNIGGNLVGVTGLSLGSARAPTIAIVDGSGNQITSFGGGTQYADNSASGATPTGTLAMGWDSANSKIRALKVDASQNLLVTFSNTTLSVTQGTSPWVVSLTSTTITGTVAVTQSTSPWVTTGNLTNNNAAPTSNNIGVLPALANAANPTWSEGDQVLMSVDLSGNQRVKINSPIPAGTNVIGHVIVDSGSISATQGTSPWVVSLTSTTITGTVAVTQSTSPWVDNLTQVAGVALGATAVVNYGSTPAATAVPGVNAFVTNTVAVTLTSTTITGTVAVTQSTSPWVVSLTSTTITGTVAVTQSTSPWVVNVSQWGGSAVQSGGMAGTVAVGGIADAGSSFAGFPVLVGGVDGTGIVTILPVGAPGSLPGNLLAVGGSDTSTLQPIPLVLGGGAVAVAIGALAPDAPTDAVSNSFGLVGFAAAGGGSANPALIASYIFNGSTWDRTRTAGVGNSVVSTGLAVSVAYGQYNSTLPTVSSGKYAALQTDACGRLLTSDRLLDEQGNLVQLSDWYVLYQAMLYELRAIRIGMQHLVSEMDNSKGPAYSLIEVAQEYDEEVMT